MIIICKSTEVYRKAPRPPDHRWWEQEGPTGLTHPKTNCAIFVGSWGGFYPTCLSKDYPSWPKTSCAIFMGGFYPTKDYNSTF